MFAPIAQAISKGFSSTQVLKHIAKKYPEYSNVINTSLAAGYTAEMILKKISGKEGKSKNSDQFLTEHEKTVRKDKENKKQDRVNALSALGAAGAVGAGLYGLSQMGRAGQAIRPSEIIQTQKPLGIPATQMRRGLPAPGQPAGATQAPTAPPMPTPPPVAPTAPPTPSPVQGKASDIINSLNIGSQVKNIATINTAKDTAAVIEQHMLTKEQKKFLKKNNINLEQVVGQYLQEVEAEENQPIEQQAQQEAAPQQPAQEAVPQEVAPPPEPPRKEMGSVVVTPNGEVGEIKAKDKAGVLVEVNGKAKRYTEDQLEGEDKDVVEAVQQILDIPEVDRSSIVSLFTYDPEDNAMYIQFHTGDTYKYLDVDPKKVYAVANKMGIPITKGKNIFGAWSPQDKKSLGATLIQEIMKDPKYAKPKHGQPENPNYRRLDTLYDYWTKLRKPPKRKK